MPPTSSSAGEGDSRSGCRGRRRSCRRCKQCGRAAASPGPSTLCVPRPPPPASVPNCWVLGLDVTHRCRITGDQLAALEGRGAHGSFLRAITQFYLEYHR